MKRVFLFILFLLLLQGVSALSFDNLNEIYSLGSNLIISGSGEDGFLSLKLECSGNVFEIGGVQISDGTFSKQVYLTKDMLGDCAVVGKINDVETKSNSFKISNELAGEFSISKNSVFLGENFFIEGNVKNLDGTGVNGFGKIYFKNSGNVVFSDSVRIAGGKFDYTTKLGAVPAGDYTIDIFVEDQYGNEKNYADYFNLKVVYKIALNSNLDKQLYKPGDELVVSGGVDKKNVDVIVEIDGKQFVVSDKEGFVVKYVLPKNTKSGSHDILVKAKDDFGNYGELNLKYDIESIPTKLNLNAEEDYNPGADISVFVVLYDQANELIAGTYKINIYDGLKKILEEEHALNEEAKLKLPEFAKPGIRKVKVWTSGLSGETQFSVNEFKKLEISLNEDILSIRNIGNVNFNEKLTIKGNELIGSKQLYLGLNEFEDVDLSSLFNEGTYNIEVPLTGQKFEGVNVDKAGVFGGIGMGMNSITGFAVYNIKQTYNKYGDFIIGGLILFIILLFLLNLDSRRRVINRVRAKEFMRGQKRLKELQQMPRRSERYDYRKASSEDVEYFKNNVVRSYQETEKQGHRNKIYNRPGDYSRFKNDSYNKPKDEPSSGGLFSMFK